MAKELSTETSTKVKKLSEENRIGEYKKDYTAWSNVLDKYHTNRFDTNYRQYTAYADTKGTESRVSDPVAPELIERVIQKLFERDPKFFVLARGYTLPKEMTDLISSVAEYYWTNPEIIQSAGSRRAMLKLIGREFCVTGNAGTETYFDNKADTPSFRLIPIEDIIFDPTKTLKTSDKYYIRQFVDMDYLKNNKVIQEDGKVVSGLFKHIPELERETKEASIKDTSIDNKITRSGSSLYADQEKPIELISVWEDSKLVQIANWMYIIREIDDPMQIGDDPLNFIMDIEVPKQPYAFSLLDWINDLTHAKNMILNQVIDYGAKALNPPLFADPNIAPINRATLSNAWKIGGLVFAAPGQAQHQPMPNMPSVGFDLMTYIQQRAESTLGIGAYTGGVPNSVSDKTQGTASGIKSLIEQAVSPIKDRQINMEESIIEPTVNQWLKMAGALMGSNEIKYIYVSGQSPKWVKITKGILTGKITLDDLITAEMMQLDEAAEIAAVIESEGKDPSKELIFDVDWIIRVETGSMAETDIEDELTAFDSAIQMGLQFGLPLDINKIWIERAIKAGIKDPEQYIKQQTAQPEQMGQIGQNPNQPMPPVSNQTQSPLEMPQQPTGLSPMA